MNSNESKPGYLTTEFWITIFANLGGILDLTNAWKFIPHQWAVIGIAIINAAYAVSRGIAKQGIPYSKPN